MTGLLINIDNGGTLTDFCVVDGDTLHRTKTVTTPYDLSKCLFEGLAKVSRLLYGQEDLQRLMLATSHIRYSTTQGTNALVERKGPRLGLVLIDIEPESLRAEPRAAALFDTLIGDRVATLDGAGDDRQIEIDLTQAINRLAGAGANRIVIGAGARDNGGERSGGGERSTGGERGAMQERRLAKILLSRFPPHLLGALPILYSYQLVEDDVHSRRVWTAIFNAFLHPTMERFLYRTEQRLKDSKTRNPLLVFRNDGGASRIARTSAVKTYSSGPRGGAEATRALASHYGLERSIGIDIGGTTTDLCLVEEGVVKSNVRGQIDGVTISLPLLAVESVGVGGSSIIRVVDGKIAVGPESVGGAPGPACFGLGGTQATITDAFLSGGLLDAASYFGGELKVDIARAAAAIDANLAVPLGLTAQTALSAMEDAWVAKVVEAIKQYAPVTAETTLVAFGGAGPFVICRVAQALGAKRVLIPGLAAIFSAFGVGFSDIAHDFEATLEQTDDESIARARTQLVEQARRAMFGEGFALEKCRIDEWLRVSETIVQLLPAQHAKAMANAAGQPVALGLRATLRLPRTVLRGRFGIDRPTATSAGMRHTWVDGQWQDLPLYRIEDQCGARGVGPAILEDAFYTSRIASGWIFECDASGDILLTC
jgi:N-methylhydantoinase A